MDSSLESQVELTEVQKPPKWPRHKNPNKTACETSESPNSASTSASENPAIGSPEQQKSSNNSPDNPQSSPKPDSPSDPSVSEEMKRSLAESPSEAQKSKNTNSKKVTSPHWVASDSVSKNTSIWESNTTQ